MALQAGIFEGQSPFAYNPANPIILFLFQVIIILLVCHLVHAVLSHFRQPRVVSEVVGGLILGPSVLGHIPNYSETLFPPTSMPIFTNASTLGLCFLLFLVGLETDLSVVKRHWRPAATVAGLGISIPLALGVAVALGLYRSIEKAKEDHVEFGVFALFVGLAMAITAFPVLARILMELDLLGSSVGVIALSAGVANDVIGWTLLAVSVALAQSSTGAIAIYIVLCCMGWVILLIYLVRPVLVWFMGDILLVAEQEQNEVMLDERHVSVISFIALVSSLFTGMIGIHPIFGAFLAGAIVPKQGNLHEQLANRFSTFVYNVLLPPFFALSGINTNISSLTSGTAWAYVVVVVGAAFVGKVLGGFVGAKLCSINTRESFTIGILMSCKGIVELIALNIGLQAKIISQETFTIMVIMAILLTGLTQPFVMWVFPKNRHGKTIQVGRTGQSVVSETNGPATTVVHQISVDLEKNSMPK